MELSHKPTFEIKRSLKEINKKNGIVYYSVSEDPVIKRTVIKSNSLLTTASAHSERGEGKRGEGNGEILSQKTIKVVCGETKGFIFDK